MKRKMVLITFLLFLYICPTILYLSYGPSAIATAPNMNKDFSLATYGDESPESITSFSETLPDNVLFYPDAFTNGTSKATSGDAGYAPYNDYTYTWDDLLTDYGGTSPTLEAYVIVNFTLPTVASEIEYFDYAVNCAGANDDDAANISIYDFTNLDWVILDSVSLGINSWKNGTLTNADYWSDTQVSILINSTDGDSSSIASIAYAEVTFYRMTFRDSNHYAESFADVSDWSDYGAEAGDSMTSDNDVATIVFHDDDNAEYWQTTWAGGVITNYYLEVRYKYNTTALGSSSAVGIIKGGLFGSGGSAAQYWTLVATSTNWITQKQIVTSADSVTGIYFYMGNAAGDYQVQVDYLRISPATESGWQHDGSTTQGVSADNDANFDYVFSSDGDILNITTTVDTGSSYNGDTLLVYDTTATAANLEDSYYPFFEIYYKCAVDGGNYYMYVRYGGKTTTSLLITDNTWHTLRINIAAGSSSSSANILFRYYRNIAGQTAHLLIDYAKAYSIANFTVTQHASATTSDYYYVNDDNDLVRAGESSGAYILLDHDPTLSVSTITYSGWNLTVSNSNPTGNDDYGIRPTGTGITYAWIFDTTRGSFGGSLLTDIQIITYRINTISAIKFIDTRLWQDVNVVTIIVDAQISPATLWALNNLYILLGAGFVILSGVYLVKGGKSDLSMEKFFFATMAFIVGWALIIGGVMP